MAKNIYLGIDGVSRKIKQPYIGVNGVTRKISSGYIGVNGVARQFWISGTPIGNLAVGTTVYLTESGMSTPVGYIIIHQGIPSTTYDSSCDGTWLLRNRIRENHMWSSQTSEYGKSDIHVYLNSTVLNRFSAGIVSAIKQVKIPYVKGTGKNASVSSGSNGLSTKLFLLSYKETGITKPNSQFDDGTVLSIFSTSDNLVALNESGSADVWWLRTPTKSSSVSPSTTAKWIGTNGRPTVSEFIAELGIRPAFILPSTQLVDSSFNVIA